MTVPLPRYTGTIIAACPDCSSDLQDEAFSYWCAVCQRSWSFTQVAFYDDRNPDD